MAFSHKGVVSRKNCYMIDPTKIQVREGWNPRQEFGGEEDIELKEDIIQNGVLNPLTVKKLDDDLLLLLHGERRLRAVLEAISEGHDIVGIPCFVERQNISDTEALFINLSNMKGKGLTPLEEAGAFNRLKNWGVSVADIANRLGKSRLFVYKRLCLVDASEELKQEIKDKNIHLHEAEEIVKKSNGSIEKQKEKIKEVKERKKLKPMMKREAILEIYKDFATRNSEDDYTDGYNKGVIAMCKVVVDNDDFYLDQIE